MPALKWSYSTVRKLVPFEMCLSKVYLLLSWLSIPFCTHPGWSGQSDFLLKLGIFLLVVQWKWCLSLSLPPSSVASLALSPWTSGLVGHFSGPPGAHVIRCFQGIQGPMMCISRLVLLGHTDYTANRFRTTKQMFFVLFSFFKDIIVWVCACVCMRILLRV